MKPYGWLMRRSVWLCVLYLLVVPSKGYSLDPSRRISQYGHTLWRTQDGLVNATSLITQTTDGYIWTPTASGLARFDGVNFVPWMAPRDIPFLLRNFPTLLGANDGSLWIGTSHGLGRLKDGEFHSYSRPGDRWGIFSIIEDHTGNIWVTRYHLSSGEGAICEAQQLNYERSAFRIRIRDNGMGIDSAILRQGHRDGHFGLPGMRERAHKIGAHLDVWSRAEAGTEVELQIPAGVAYVSDPDGSWLWKLRRLWPGMKQEDGPREKGHAPT